MKTARSPVWDQECVVCYDGVVVRAKLETFEKCVHDANFKLNKNYLSFLSTLVNITSVWFRNNPRKSKLWLLL